MIPGTRFVCVREVQKSLKESVKLLLEDKIGSLGVGGNFGIFDSEIRSSGNGLILFQGMQDHTAESIKSLEGFDVAYVEEAQTMSARSLEILRPTIRKPGSELWFSWNPRNAGDPVDAFLRGPEPPPDAVVVKTNYFDNPFFPAVLEQERAFDEIHYRDRYGHIWLGEYEPAVVGAIWDRVTIHQGRRSINDVPALKRIVVAVDPAISSEPDSNETGIVVCALGEDDRGYLLDDLSTVGNPRHWAERVVAGYDLHEADAVVIEINQGGEMCRNTLKSVRPELRIIEVRATRGKHVRAEPISALYSLGKISHVGTFPKLEDQMCLEKGTLIETARGQVPVEQVTSQDWVMTREGFAPLKWAGYTGEASRFIEINTSRSQLRVTECHPIFLPQTNEFVSARNVVPSHYLLESPKWASMDHPLRGVAGGGVACRAAITEIQKLAGCFTGRFTKRTLGRLFRTTISIIETTIRQTIVSTTSLHSLAPNIMPSIGGLDSMSLKASPSESVPSAAERREQFARVQLAIVAIRALNVRTGVAKPVYNLSVADGYLPEYFANGILTHNCLMTAAGYEGDGSPDRVDGLVWGFTELFPRMTRRAHVNRPNHANSDYRPQRGLIR